MDNDHFPSLFYERLAENVRKNNALLERLKANMPTPTPERWYEAFWRGFCAPFRAWHAFWIVATGQGYVRRYDDYDD